MSKISIPGSIVCGVVLVVGGALAIWGGAEFAATSRVLIGLGIGFLVRFGAFRGGK